jgi:hypothetical protein
MLNVTAAAIAWLHENRARHGVPDEYGVRIFTNHAGEGIAVHSAAGPVDDEVTVMRQGLRFFLTREIAESLDGRTIDAADRPTGSGLVIRRRPANGQGAAPGSPTGKGQDRARLRSTLARPNP